MIVHVDTMTGFGRRVEAEVPSSSQWRQKRNGSYWVDLIQGVWFCTCYRSSPAAPCRHARQVAEAVDAPLVAA